MSERNQKKNPLFEEFEKLRKETAGINSIMQNPSSGLVSQTTLNEILEVLGKMSKKQEELEEQIMENRLKIQENSTGELWKKIDEKFNTLSGKFEKSLEERTNENRKVQERNQKKKLKIHNKLDDIGQELKTQQKSTSESSREVKEKFKQLSGKIDKLEKGLKTVIEKLDQRPENRHQPNRCKPSLNNPNIANQPKPPMNKPSMTNVSSELQKREKTEEQSKKEGESSSNQQSDEDNDDDETIRVKIIDVKNYSRTIYIEVKKSDKIKILDSEVIDHFAYKPSRYSYCYEERRLDPVSTFGENSVKDRDVIWCKNEFSK